MATQNDKGGLPPSVKEKDPAAGLDIPSNAGPCIPPKTNQATDMDTDSDNNAVTNTIISEDITEFIRPKRGSPKSKDPKSSKRLPKIRSHLANSQPKISTSKNSQVQKTSRQIPDSQLIA